jgi:hypothetical protein
MKFAYFYSLIYVTCLEAYRFANCEKESKLLGLHSYHTLIIQHSLLKTKSLELFFQSYVKKLH